MDIVANLVGIMIILLVIVGARASLSGETETPAPSPEQTQTVEALNQKLSSTRHSVEKLRSDNSDQYRQIAEENQIAAELTVRRHQMLVEIELLKQARKQKEEQLKIRLASWEQQERNTQIKRIAYEQETRALQKQLQEIESQIKVVERTTVDDSIETIDHYPNPIARTVFTKELHFRLADGKLSYVPMEELLATMKSEWKLKAEKLGASTRTIETVGPIDGYRLQYELEQQTIVEPSQFGPIERDMVQFKRFVIAPAPTLQEESVARALKTGSNFWKRLESFPPDETTVSVWVYPDGFADHQRIKAELYKRGFQMASWPLLPGRPISGGPDGLKTSAQ